MRPGSPVDLTFVSLCNRPSLHCLELKAPLFPLAQLDWRFCQELTCNGPDRVDDLQGRLWTRLWLQQLKGDPLTMSTLRDLLSNHTSLPLSRLTDTTLVDQMAELLTSGRLHLHAKKMEAHPVGTPKATEDAAPFPISEHQPRYASSPPPLLDPPTFPSNVDLSAQSAALVAAAAQGTPFCLE